jgi:hypothetical protein
LIGPITHVTIPALAIKTGPARARRGGRLIERGAPAFSGSPEQSE